jgi:hypothetical protein
MTDTTETPISDLDLPPYLANCLRKMNVRTLEDLIKKSPRFLLSTRGLGKGSLATIQARLAEFGTELATDPPTPRRPRTQRPGLRQECAPYMQAGETIPEAMARLHKHLQTACTKLMNNKHQDTTRIADLEQQLAALRTNTAPYLQPGETIVSALKRHAGEMAAVNAQREALQRLVVQLTQRGPA